MADEIEEARQQYRQHLAALQAGTPSRSPYFREYGQTWWWSQAKEQVEATLARQACESLEGAERQELEDLRRYFQACEQAFGRQHWNADAILSHFHEDGSLKGEGKWRGREVHSWLLKWQEAQGELNAIEFSGGVRAACDVPVLVAALREARDFINNRCDPKHSIEGGDIMQQIDEALKGAVTDERGEMPEMR